MRYWKTSILWICLTPWHLAYFGEESENVSMPEVLWPAIIPSRSFLPHSQSSSPCTLAALWGRAAPKGVGAQRSAKGSGRRAELWSCQDHLPASGGSQLLSAGVHHPPLCQLESLCTSLCFFHRYLWGVFMQQGQVRDSWGRERFWGFAWTLLEKLRRVLEKLSKAAESS